MTWEDRVLAIGAKGFTDRQARFLVPVLLHAGVCVARQYCAFAGVARGKETHQFFGSLLERKYATAYAEAHRKAHIFHLQGRSLYEAIGEPHSHHRKPTPLGGAIERLMLLDAVLDDSSVRWLATEREKLAHFTLLWGADFRRDDLPRTVYGTGGARLVRYFPDKLPIGVDPDSRTHVFVYLIRRASPIEFRGFLQRHAEVLRALSRWELRLLVPAHFEVARKAYLAAVHQELASPLHPDVADEVRWYFERRSTGLQEGSAEAQRFARARRSFSKSRYRVLHRNWRQQGRSAVDATVSTTLANALDSGTGVVEFHRLRHAYLHLSGMAGTA